MQHVGHKTSAPTGLMMMMPLILGADGAREPLSDLLTRLVESPWRLGLNGLKASLGCLVCRAALEQTRLADGPRPVRLRL